MLLLGTEEMCELMDVSRPTLGLWVKKGCPKFGRGKWRARDVLEWWLLNIYVGMERGSGPEDESMLEVKRQYWQAKAEKERIGVDQMKEELIPRENIASEWAWRMAEVANGLQALAMRLPPLLEGKTQIEMREIIDEEQWVLRDNYCRTGRFCLVEEEGEENE